MYQINYNCIFASGRPLFFPCFEITFSDTAFRLNGDRLPCPHCTDQNLSLSHLLYTCDHLAQERQDAKSFTKKTTGKMSDFSKTDLLPNFCNAGKNKIKSMTKLARSRHPAIQRRQNNAENGEN